MSLADDWMREQQEDDRLKREWSLGDYTGEACENCGRFRVCKCPNGKRRCEKCNWVPEDKSYAPVNN